MKIKAMPQQQKQQQDGKQSNDISNIINYLKQERR